MSPWRMLVVVAALLLAGFGVYQIAEGNTGSGALMIAIAVADVALVTMLTGRGG